jgi:hypothetical protein
MSAINAVLNGIIPALKADAALLLLVDSDHNRVRRRVGPANVPGVEYTVIADGMEELLAPIDIQFSLFAEDWATITAMEDRLYALLHHEAGPVTIGGVLMNARKTQGRTIEDPAEGVIHRAVDYEFTIVRAKAL